MNEEIQVYWLHEGGGTEITVELSEQSFKEKYQDPPQLQPQQEQDLEQVVVDFG